MKGAAVAMTVAGLTCLFAVRTVRSGPVRITVTDDVVVADVRRFGINLGTWTSWGAEQFPSNVLKNPGFEGLIDRAIAIAAFSGPDEFSDDMEWLARPDGFWAGASYEVLTGSAAGTRGRIRDSRARGAGGLPVFFTEGAASPVGHGDVVALTRVDDKSLPTQWWMGDPGTVAIEDAPRPGSPGIRSVNLRSPGARVSSYLDAIGDRAGKLLPVEGSWCVAFWARGSRPGALLAARFVRGGSAAFLDQSVRLASEWRQYKLPFGARDTGPAGTLELSFTNASDGSAILLDDVQLGPAGITEAFRKEVIAALDEFRPGYLRDWQGQLGDTLENRVSSAFGRRASRYRPGGPEATDFNYGLEETLALCRRVKANPWLVVPTTFGIDECAGFGRYLAANARGFDEVLVEFGNENWNPLFRPAGIPDAEAHAAAATRCSDAIRNNAGGTPLRTVVNAQAAAPENVLKIASLATRADAVAIAPYLLFSLPAGLSPAQARAALFPRVSMAPPRISQDLAVYEVNLHTIDGEATAEERRPVIESAAAGAALASTMLENLRSGARRQCVYTLAGFDARLAKVAGYAELWGVTRDLAPTPHWRATGHAILLLNRALDGSLARTSGESRGIEVFAFRSQDAWSAAVVNRGAAAERVEIRFPGGAAPGRAILLGDDGERGNSLPQRQGLVELDAPGQSLTVLLPREGVS